jgi:phosphatidylglycerophosphatase A
VTDRLAYFIATAAYVGRFPIAPGTAGTLAGLALYASIRYAGGGFVGEAIALIAVLVLGIWSANSCERLCGLKDPGEVVIDEVLGILISLAFLNVTMTGAIAAFFLFRILDVLKPFPAGRMEHLPGGYGIMLDDAMAGVYSYLGMRVLLLVWPGVFA